MHTLQPKHFKLKKDDIKKILKKYNISLPQIPKISKKDVCVPEDCDIGDVLRIERKSGGEINEYFRVVVG